MDEALSVVTGWLICASSQIGSEYIQLPVAGQEEPEYRERVYCYELYHRWRCHWPASFEFSLSGEVDKGRHPLIRGSPKPDFLVHVPGEMRNLLAVEVKPKNADIARMADDLIKLTRFRREWNYHAAYFWVYGTSKNDWPLLREEIVRKVAGTQDVDFSLISCFVHERAGVPALRVGWR
jgi:hypothetical protein